MNHRQMTSPVISPVASRGLQLTSTRKRKLGTANEDSSPLVTFSTPTRWKPSNVKSDPQRPVAATTPKDFRVLSSESLFKRRKLEAETKNIVSESILALPLNAKYSAVASDLRGPLWFPTKALTVRDSPRNDRVMTPLNLTSNRCDLFDDGSIGKLLGAREVLRRRSQVSSRRNLFPLSPGNKGKSSQSPLVGLQPPLGEPSDTAVSVNSVSGFRRYGAGPGRSLFATPKKDLPVTPLCRQITSKLSISSPFTSPPRTPVAAKKDLSVTPLCNAIASTVCISTPLNKPQGTPVAVKKTKSSHCESPKPAEAAIEKSLENPDLVGDFSKGYLLPTVQGKNPDIPSISPSTMAKILNGEYEEESFLILDCRYPYEYIGGHIKGAKNFYTKKELTKKLFPSNISLNSGSRPILIFHCEFSSERGPNMYRFVRKKDRQMNTANYPSLFYPESYLLEGGYCAFYASHKELCDPQAYKTMRNEENTRDLVNFRAECKAEKKDQSSKAYHGVVIGKIEFPTTPEI